MIGLASHLTLRQTLKHQWIRGSKSPYQEIIKKDQRKIVNHYKLKLSYYKNEKTKLKVIHADSALAQKIKIIIPEEIIEFETDNIEVNVFFEFHIDLLMNGVKSLPLNLVDEQTGAVIKDSMEVKLVGPLR